jgi:branched-chain amino acid transport system substrate-binding protein
MRVNRTAVEEQPPRAQPVTSPPRHRPSRLWGTVAVLAAALIVGGCGDSRAGGGDSVDEGGDDGSDARAGTFTIDASHCPEDASRPLDEGEPIKVGVSMALSGPLAAIGSANIDGLRAALAAVNSEGGIDGHEIELIVKDDAYDPARATANAQAFVGQDGVFVNLLQISEASITGSRPIYEAACVPQLGTISQNKETTAPEEHPWTTVTIPPAIVEAEAAAEYIADKVPGAEVMEFRQQATIGEDWAETFPGAAEERGLTLLEVQSIAPTEVNLDQHAARLTASGADAVVGEMQGPMCIAMLQSLSKAGFDGEIVLTSACNGAKQFMEPLGEAADGVAALFFQKDPSVPGAESDPGLKQYFEDMAEYQPNADPTVTMALNGYEAGTLLAQNLRDAAQADGGLTRVNLMEAAWNVSIERPSFLEPVQSMSGADDPYIINHVAVLSYDATTGGWIDSGVSFTYTGD